MLQFAPNIERPFSLADVRGFISVIEGLNIETINACNYAEAHTKCPTKMRREKFGHRQLSMEILEVLFRELNDLGFRGRIGLHHYSEPLLDPRIIPIVHLADRTITRGKVNIWSNGTELTRDFGRELIEAGVHYFRLSAYSDAEYRRLAGIIAYLEQLYPDRQYELFQEDLDERNGLYTAPILNFAESCWDARELLIINSLGDLQLCCRDYLCTYTFGNIYQKRLRDILAESDYLAMRQDLVQGLRYKYDLCRRCPF